MKNDIYILYTSVVWAAKQNILKDIDMAPPQIWPLGCVEATNSKMTKTCKYIFKTKGLI